LGATRKNRLAFWSDARRHENWLCFLSLLKYLETEAGPKRFKAKIIETPKKRAVIAICMQRDPNNRFQMEELRRCYGVSKYVACVHRNEDWAYWSSPR